jgi:enoyl-[acyl-carrier protein] reductase/trans-2-enoyl-CoA reductase (NAD+)
LDSDNRFRVDELELLPEMQAKVEKVWPIISTENLNDLSDFAAYQSEFLRLFGFAIEGVNYEEDIDTEVENNFI